MRSWSSCLPPDHAHRRGEPRLAWRRERVVDIGHAYRSGRWSLSTKGRLPSKRVETHVRWLLELVRPKASLLRELAATYDADVFCFAYAPTHPSLPRALHEEAAGVGLTIDIDFYDSVPDDGETTGS